MWARVEGQLINFTEVTNVNVSKFKGKHYVCFWQRYKDGPIKVECETGADAATLFSKVESCISTATIFLSHQKDPLEGLEVRKPWRGTGLEDL